ncbi:uncharacterized protein OCT59_028592 [Rhizophagus irregularis]|uniref:uncharacterized protein n=1 Tax=Rhizophagus irregularis TaxID=588596 RepID=UPI003331EBAB|nr:hypothetical protein OCT59_028592 [Rhizophagus irregularis]
MSSDNDLLLDDETFLKEFLKGFYRRIVKIDSNNYENFEDILLTWLQYFFFSNKKNPEIILKLMENHKENENWFSSLIGFFYDHNIISSIIDKDKSLKLYLLSIYNYKDENKKLITDMYQLLNIIISKYLLSFYYYREIILYERNFIEKEFEYLENVHHVMSHNQVENFDGLEINLCKDEINTMEKYFESRDKGFDEIQIKKRKLIELNNLGYCYQYGVGKKKDEFKAFEFYLKSAEGGNSDAQNNLGYCYQNGIGITKDEKKAFEWYLKASNESNLHAQYNLGICYQNGIGTNKDDKKALEYYIKSAKGEYLPAQYILGNCYQNEVGIEKDLEKAIYWYRKAADNGNKIAQYNLGNYYKNGEAEKGDNCAQINLGLLYETGEGTEIDLEMAVYWYKKAAENEYKVALYKLGLYYQIGKVVEKDETEKGNHYAQNSLGFMYENGGGTEKNKEKAFYWYNKAAENGNRDAQYNLGECYELGNGVVDKDETKAFEYYEKSAENGDIDSKFQLGYCYVNGIGTEVDEEKGFELYNEASGGYIEVDTIENDEELVNDLDKVNYWYHKAAENDNEFALFKLGNFYELGKGICENKVRAFEFYKKSANQGFIDAQYKLGYFYENGIGIDINKEKAFNSYKIAATEGNVNAQKNLAVLYERGEGTDKNIENAIYWYKKVIENGCLDVQENLSALLIQQ